MKRRAFLKVAAKAGAAAAITAATWPQFLRDAFADEPIEPPAAPEPEVKKSAAEQAKRERMAVLSDGYRRAQQAGKPLLVIIIPADESQKWTRGEWFGSWLNHGSPAELHALALCEVVCGTMNDLRQLVPTVGLGDPLLVLVETDRIPATVRRLEARMPDDARTHARAHSLEEYQELEKHENQLIDTRIALLGKLVHGAVVGDVAQLEHRIEQLRSAQPAAVAIVEAALQSGQKIADADADHAAALIALKAQNDKAARSELQKQLTRVVDARLRKQRVPGSHWARHSGCGTTIEDVNQQMMVACGMGHVPEKSWRFLYFFSISKNGTLLE